MNSYLYIDERFFLDITQVVYASHDDQGHLLVMFKNSSSICTFNTTLEVTKQILTQIALWNHNLNIKKDIQ